MKEHYRIEIDIVERKGNTLKKQYYHSKVIESIVLQFDNIIELTRHVDIVAVLVDSVNNRRKKKLVDKPTMNIAVLSGYASNDNGVCYYRYGLYEYDIYHKADYSSMQREENCDNFLTGNEIKHEIIAAISNYESM